MTKAGTLGSQKKELTIHRYLITVFVSVCQVHTQNHLCSKKKLRAVCSLF